MLSLMSTPTGVLIATLLLGVVFVNGWTDSPNAIATGCITKALSFSRCALLCGVFNLLGVLISPIFAEGVSENVFSLIDTEDSRQVQIIIISTLVTTILFGVVAWFFGMPTSESHGMLCGLLGSTAFFGGALQFYKIGTLLFHLFVSVLLALVLSLAVGLLFKRKRVFGSLGAISCLCALSLMHGCQDGQKFIGILKAFVSKADTHPDFFTNLSIVLPIGIVMLLGSLLGGKRIIKTYKNASTEDSPSYFMSSDIGTIFSILLCSIFGMAISTGIVKLFSLVGSALAFRKEVNKRVATATLLVALATLPICFVMGYFVSSILDSNSSFLFVLG
ncbi:MAG: inorganic phosphate transporter [Clostridia bacterium]|nr:inorganic phosphate transporter [Clostridia bacterium]